MVFYCSFHSSLTEAATRTINNFFVFDLRQNVEFAKKIIINLISNNFYILLEEFPFTLLEYSNKLKEKFFFDKNKTKRIFNLDIIEQLKLLYKICHELTLYKEELGHRTKLTIEDGKIFIEKVG